MSSDDWQYFRDVKKRRQLKNRQRLQQNREVCQALPAGVQCIEFNEHHWRFIKGAVVMDFWPSTNRCMSIEPRDTTTTKLAGGLSQLLHTLEGLAA